MDIDQLNQFKIIILSGLPGSGKTTLTKKIAKQLSAVHISSDQIRLNIFKVGSHRATHDDKVAAVGPKVYSMMATLAIEAYEDGKKVVLDATFMDQKRDQVLNELLKTIPTNEICFIVLDKTVKEIEKILKKSHPNVYKNWKDLIGYWELQWESGKIGFPNNELYPEIKIFNSKSF